MNAQREPYVDGLEPFVQGSEPEIPSEMPEIAPDFEKPTKKVRKSVKLTVELPASLGFRLEHVIEAERRLPYVVMEKVLADFLAEATAEPRPYIPPEIWAERRKPYYWRIDSELVDRIKFRAVVEGRDHKVLVIRAVYDYVRASPDDLVGSGTTTAEGGDL